MTTYSDTAIHILHTARDLFAEEGFHAVSTKRIAKAAKVNEVTLFRSFGSKAKLFEAVIEECIFLPDFGALLAMGQAPIEDFLRQLGLTLNRFMEKNQTLIKIELMSPGPSLGERRLSRFPQGIRDILAEKFQHDLQLSPEEAYQEAVLFMTGLHGLCMNLYIFKTLSDGIHFATALEAFVKKFVPNTN